MRQYLSEQHPENLRTQERTEISLLYPVLMRTDTELEQTELKARDTNKKRSVCESEYL